MPVAPGELTSAQRRFLDRLIATELVERFYLSGGTALAVFHLDEARALFRELARSLIRFGDSRDA